MNEATLVRLKTVVERAVRPVVASTSWKLRTREELLAHVTAVFEDELARLRDETLALVRTEERFGRPAELTEHLQDSVPRNDRVTDFFERVLDGTVVNSWRLAACFMAFAATPAAALLVAFFVQGRAAEWPIAAGFFILGLSWIVVVGGLRSALFGPRGRSWPRAVLFGMASWFVIPGWTFALCLVFTGDWRSSLVDGAKLLPIGVVTPAALLCWACAFVNDVQAKREWARIQVD